MEEVNRPPAVDLQSLQCLPLFVIENKRKYRRQGIFQMVSVRVVRYKESLKEIEKTV